MARIIYSEEFRVEAVKKIGMEIYKNDEDRANLLMLSTKELVKKVKEDNDLNIDTLIASIQRELRLTPRGMLKK